MAEGEKQARSEFYGITPLQDTTNLSQQLQGNITSIHTATTIIPGSNTNTTNIAITTGPLTSVVEKNTKNLQLGMVEDNGTIVSHSLLQPGLENVNTQSTAAYQNVSVPKESSIASGSFLFGPSDDAFSKDHGQMLCASDGAGNTIPLPVRQSSFSETNPLTPVRNKMYTNEYTDQGAPLTPTANLKLLLSAASPAIREREQLMQQNTRNVCRSILTDTDVSEEFEYSRKQKSLSILCSRCGYVYPHACMCGYMYMHMCEYIVVYVSYYKTAKCIQTIGDS